MVEPGAELRLVSPYVTAGYVEALVRPASSWRLLTDIEAWIESERAGAPDVAAFVERNHPNVRDVRRLHAKVAIGPHRAFVGSANLTRLGLEQRAEMGVLLEVPDLVRELREWFDALWDAGGVPAVEPVRAYADAASALAARLAHEPTPQLGAAGPRIRALDAFAPTATDVLPATEDEARLVTALRQLGTGADEATAVLDRLADAIATSGLGADDHRLAVTVRKTQGVGIHVNVRMWRVVGWGAPDVLWILGDRALLTDEHVIREYERPAQGAIRGQWLKVRWPRPPLPDAFLASWRERIRECADAKGASPHRRWHSPAAYRAVVDPAYRARVLRTAYG